MGGVADGNSPPAGGALGNCGVGLGGGGISGDLNNIPYAASGGDMMRDVSAHRSVRVNGIRCMG